MSWPKRHSYFEKEKIRQPPSRNWRAAQDALQGTNSIIEMYKLGQTKQSDRDKRKLAQERPSKGLHTENPFHTV